MNIWNENFCKQVNTIVELWIVYNNIKVYWYTNHFFQFARKANTQKQIVGNMDSDEENTYISDIDTSDDESTDIQIEEPKLDDGKMVEDAQTRQKIIISRMHYLAGMSNMSSTHVWCLVND